jgi:hypothetical protein
MNAERFPASATQELPPDFVDRRSDRTPLNIKTRLTQQNWSGIDVILRDLSSSGFMAESQASVPIGSYVTLEVAGLGPIRAQIRWQLGPRLGGMFLDAIRLDRCDWPVLRGESQG